MSIKMSDFEKEMAELTQDMQETPEEQLPSLEEQKAVVAKLKELEAKGELTAEVLEKHFGKFYAKTDNPIH